MHLRVTIQESIANLILVEKHQSLLIIVVRLLQQQRSEGVVQSGGQDKPCLDIGLLGGRGEYPENLLINKQEPCNRAE